MGCRALVFTEPLRFLSQFLKISHSKHPSSQTIEQLLQHDYCCVNLLTKGVIVRKVLLSTFALFLFAGCATTTDPLLLTKEGREVRIIPAPSVADETKKFERLTDLTCEVNSYYSKDLNRQNCETVLKNKAAITGADFLVIKSEDTKMLANTVGVKLVATAYRKK
jgi:hypothetical protein